MRPLLKNEKVSAKLQLAANLSYIACTKFRQRRQPGQRVGMFQRRSRRQQIFQGNTTQSRQNQGWGGSIPFWHGQLSFNLGQIRARYQAKPYFPRSFSRIIPSRQINQEIRTCHRQCLIAHYTSVSNIKLYAECQISI